MITVSFSVEKMLDFLIDELEEEKENKEEKRLQI